MIDDRVRDACTAEDETPDVWLRAECVLKSHEELHDLEDYQGGVARWCPGCGDNAILAAVQRLCATSSCPREHRVRLGIGCAAGSPTT